MVVHNAKIIEGKLNIVANEIRESASNAGMYDCPRCVYDFVESYDTQKCLNCKQGDNFVARKISNAELMYDAYTNGIPKE